MKEKDFSFEFICIVFDKNACGQIEILYEWVGNVDLLGKMYFLAHKDIKSIPVEFRGCRGLNKEQIGGYISEF